MEIYFVSFERKGSFSFSPELTSSREEAMKNAKEFVKEYAEKEKDTKIHLYSVAAEELPIS